MQNRIALMQLVLLLLMRMKYIIVFIIKITTWYIKQSNTVAIKKSLIKLHSSWLLIESNDIHSVCTVPNIVITINTKYTIANLNFVLLIMTSLWFTCWYTTLLFCNNTSNTVKGISRTNIVQIDTARSLFVYIDSSSSLLHSVKIEQTDKEAIKWITKIVNTFVFDISFSLLMKVHSQYSLIKKALNRT